MWEREREHHGESVLGDLCNGYVLVTIIKISVHMNCTKFARLYQLLLA